MQRPFYLEKIKILLDIHPICAILGPRQVGKTTLAHAYAEENFQKDVTFFDLENPLDAQRLENPVLAFSQVTTTLIVIDEIQMHPELFPILRVLVDKKDFKHKFLILGSASRDLINQSSETLAGRIGYMELPPFGLFEVHDDKQLIMRGGFPKSYLAETDLYSFVWRQNYITTFLERDIPALGFNVPALQMRRFWLMLMHYHGQTINYSAIAHSLMISDTTVRKYIDILAGTFMIRILSPWTENIAKRQVKSPKIYFRDTGILNTLLNIQTHAELTTHPRLGAFWEGFALEELIKFLDCSSEEAFFWATQAHAELDLLIFKNGKKIGFEFKYSDVPKTTKSMHSALRDLQLDQLYIVYPGEHSFKLTEQITACSLNDIVTKKILLS